MSGKRNQKAGKKKAKGVNRRDFIKVAGAGVVGAALGPNMIVPLYGCQKRVPTSRKQIPNLIGKLLGRQYRFYSNNKPDHCFRHRGGEIWLNKYPEVDSGEGFRMLRMDSAFTVVPGIAGIGISFRSENYPDHFIRHSNFECYIHKYDGSDLFKKDASWIPHTGRANDQGYSFESINYRGRYMRHKKSRVRVDRPDGSDVFEQDATWLAKLLKDVSTDGAWILVYGNDNQAADWEWSEEIEVGITLTKTSQTETTKEDAWKVGMEAGAEGFGMSVKAMFEASGMQSVTRMSSSTWQKSHSETTTKTYSGKKGEGFYLWQWNLCAITGDGEVIEVKTNLYDETTVNKQPKYTP